MTVVLLQSLLDRGKVAIHNLIQRVGFIGILLCASVSGVCVSLNTVLFCLTLAGVPESSWQTLTDVLKRYILMLVQAKQN
jgi:hypothetical protein